MSTSALSQRVQNVYIGWEKQRRDPVLGATATTLSPLQWGDTLSGSPVLSTDPNTLRRGLFRHWADTCPQMRQPALDHHVVVLHRGGAKRVRRDGEGRRSVTDVSEGALTIIPAGASADWSTEGPIEFSHLYVYPQQINRIIVEVFDRDSRLVNLVDQVGRQDALVEALLGCMMLELSTPAGVSSLYMETLFDAALVRLVREHSNLSATGARPPHALAPYRLKRAVDYIDANIQGDICLSAVSEASGLSRYHFSRAFQRATGQSPYAFVTQRRVEYAKRLLASRELPLGDIAKRCGFNSHAQFSTTFKRVTGVKPSRWRDDH